LASFKLEAAASGKIVAKTNLHFFNNAANDDTAVAGAQRYPYRTAALGIENETPRRLLHWCNELVAKNPVGLVSTFRAYRKSFLMNLA
jgi:hypothetical protein